MAQITFTEPSGKVRSVDATEGESLMKAALNHGVAGIEADCGGAMSCGTCVVHVAPQWLARTGERSQQEVDMLDFSGKDAPTARLSCQINVTPSLEGLCVRVPA